MSCDINMFVEQRTIANQSGDSSDQIHSDPNLYKWKSADKWEMSESGLTVTFENQIYTERNYEVFAILADVMNGYGFAGHKTGHGFNPISLPKGLPYDISFEVKQCIGVEDNFNYHSHSYLTLQELNEFNWNQITTIEGYVNPEGYQEYLEKGKPTIYRGNEYSESVVKISNIEMDELIINPKLPDPQDPKYYLTLVEWFVSYSECAEYFLSTVIPKLEEFSKGDPESVRIVFCFDN